MCRESSVTDNDDNAATESLSGLQSGNSINYCLTRHWTKFRE